MKVQKIALLLLWLLVGCEGFPEFVGVDPVPAEDGTIDQRLAGIWYAQDPDPDRERANAMYLHVLPAKDRIHFLYSGAGLDADAAPKNRAVVIWLAGEAFPFMVENYYLVRPLHLTGWYANQLAEIAKDKGDPPMAAEAYEPGYILARVACADSRCDALSLRWACKFEKILLHKRLAGRVLLEITAEELVKIIRDDAPDQWCEPPLDTIGELTFHRLKH